MISLQKNNRRFMKNCSNWQIRICQRYTGAMAAGTQLIGAARRPFGLIATYHNLWLRDLVSFNERGIDLQMIRFIQRYYMINPKYLQHIFSIAYPKHSFSLLEVETCFPDVGIINSRSNIAVGLDVLLPVIAGADIMKKTAIFEEGTLSVIGFPDEATKIRINSLEYQHTGQPHPDYHYQFNSKTNTWERHYDLKTGKIDVNKGHIFCVKEGPQYEEYSQKILLAQKTCYWDNVFIAQKLKELFYNKSLTWGKRNDLFQLYLKENMSQFPGINPSFVLKSKILYEIENTKPHEKIMAILNNAGPGCIESHENSVNIIGACIKNGGKTCVDNYLKIWSANSSIKKLLTITRESTDFLLEKL